MIEGTALTDYRVPCPQCGEPTREFADGVCSQCSLLNQIEIDTYLEVEERWTMMSDAEKDCAIQDAVRLIVDEWPNLSQRERDRLAPQVQDIIGDSDDSEG